MMRAKLIFMQNLSLMAYEFKENHIPVFNSQPELYLLCVARLIPEMSNRIGHCISQWSHQRTQPKQHHKQNVSCKCSARTCSLIKIAFSRKASSLLLISCFAANDSLISRIISIFKTMNQKEDINEKTFMCLLMFALVIANIIQAGASSLEKGNPAAIYSYDMIILQNGSSVDINGFNDYTALFINGTLIYRFSSNVPFLELDYPLSGAKCRYRHFALAV
jgi:hypothetical protein